MAYTKTILCLANSRKYQGRCVGGKVYEAGVFGEWIRPVTTREWEVIDPSEYAYVDGTIPQVLDLIEVPFVERRPRECQTENQLMNTRRRWRKVGSISYAGLERALDEPETLWVNGYSSKMGVNDRVPVDIAAGLTSSLLLIRTSTLRLEVCTRARPFGETKRQVRARLDFNGDTYNIVVTDLYIEAKCEGRKDGRYRVPEAYMCVSLGEPAEGHRYKLAAAIITPDRAG